MSGSVPSTPGGINSPNRTPAGPEGTTPAAPKASPEQAQQLQQDASLFDGLMQGAPEGQPGQKPMVQPQPQPQPPQQPQLPPQPQLPQQPGMPTPWSGKDLSPDGPGGQAPQLPGGPLSAEGKGQLQQLRDVLAQNGITTPQNISMQELRGIMKAAGLPEPKGPDGPGMPLKGMPGDAGGLFPGGGQIGLEGAGHGHKGGLRGPADGDGRPEALLGTGKKRGKIGDGEDVTKIGEDPANPRAAGSIANNLGLQAPQTTPLGQAAAAEAAKQPTPSQAASLAEVANQVAERVMVSSPAQTAGGQTAIRIELSQNVMPNTSIDITKSPDGLLQVQFLSSGNSWQTLNDFKADLKKRLEEKFVSGSSSVEGGEKRGITGVLITVSRSDGDDQSGSGSGNRQQQQENPDDPFPS